MDKAYIAKVLTETAILLDINGENPFKIRAYENASRIIESLTDDIVQMIENDELENLRGIGPAIKKHINEIYVTGTFEELEKLKKKTPDGLKEMLNIPGLGPKKIKFFWRELGITKIKQLEIACKKGQLRDLKGFGQKTEEKILKGIDAFRRFADKYLYPSASSIAYKLAEEIKTLKGTQKVEVAGSLRRKKEIIGDIDILVATTQPKIAMDFFADYPNVHEVIAHGETKTSVRFESGINADLRAITKEQFPYALHYFTGSKDHNVAMRSLAKRVGMKLNEYGLFKGDSLIKCKTEEDIFKTLKLDYIPPELREGLGEISAAQKNELPKLVEEKDIKGIIHVHSDYSDGNASIKELALVAKKKGYKYIGISDHSESAGYAGGLKLETLKKQWSEIDKLNKSNLGIRILKGTEVDIKKDGSIDYSNDILKQFDFVIASIHSSFQLPEKEMTNRICKALENPYVSILGHPTGRLLLQRDAYSINLDKVIDCAAKNKKSIEINSHPQRLDLDWRYVKRAKEKGIKLVICPDAHSIDGFEYITYGVNIARKGWCEKKDILNCLPVKDFLKNI